ncbi:MAG: NAD(P)H-hydrate dehydratase [Acidimicrobiales bacterium]
MADIGLDTSGAGAFLVEAHDVSAWLPERPAETHKWKTAVWIAAGSPGMTGAAHLCSRAAMRAGSGMVRLGIPGSGPDPGAPEVVGRALPAEGWDTKVLEESDRATAMVVGPGLARTAVTRDCVRRLLVDSPLPAVVDADGLFALGGRDEAADVLRRRSADTILTPHAGEFARLYGSVPGPDRVGAVRELAAALGVTVLSKGSTTVVAAPDGQVLVTTTGDSRLASAGTGDVLTGVVGALLAQDLDAPRAAAAGAFVHGRAARLGWRRGLVAGDLIDLLPRAIDGLV